MPFSTPDPRFRRRRIGLLGGSFNPAHMGHRAISLYALKRLGLDAVVWLVSPQNPLKSPNGMESFEKRLATAQRVANHPRLFVSGIEADFGTRYTVDTLKSLKKHYPKTRFVWLMGADNWRQMHRWRRWPELFQLVSIAVFRRPAYSAGRGTAKAAQRFDSACLPRTAAQQLANAKLPAWIMLDNPINALSATAIRQTKKGKENGSRKKETAAKKENSQKKQPKESTR